MNALDRTSAMTLIRERPEVRQFALRVVSQVVRGAGAAGPDRGTVLGLIDRMARHGDLRCLAQLRQLVSDRQIAREQIIDDYLPAVIGHIGTDWHEARINVLEATMATFRLQNLVREFAQQTVADQSAVCRGGSILLIMPVGEQHCLGSMIAADQMRRQGISVRLLFNPEMAQIEGALARTRFDGVFLSVSNEGLCDEIAKLVQGCRAGSGGDVPIILGGGLVAQMRCADRREALRLKTGVDYVAQTLEIALGLCNIASYGPASAV